jgi:hypothetical protein
MHTKTQGSRPYERPAITDHGSLAELTAGCVGGVPEDSLAGADTQTFPADSGLFCGP